MSVTNSRSTTSLLILGLLAITLPACRTQTREAEAQQKLREAAELRAAEQRETNLTKMAEMDEKDRQLKRDLRRVELRKERTNKIVYAGNELKGGNFEACLELVDELLAPIAPEDPFYNPDYVAPPDLTTREKAGLYETRAIAHYKLKNNEDAIAAYREALGYDSNLRRARKNLGRILYQEKRYEEALDLFLKELEDGYRSTDILFYLGRCQYEIGKAKGEKTRYESARIAMFDSVLADPTDVTKMRWLAFLEFETGRFEESIRLLEAIRKEHPLDTEYLDMLANAYNQTGRPEKAIEYLELAASIKPPPVVTCESLGDLYSRTGQSARAAEWFRKAYRDDPANTDTGMRLYVGQLLAESGEPDEALRWLDAIDASAEHRANARSLAATVLLDLEREDEALEAFEEIQKLRPMDCAVWLAAADVLLDRGDLDEAREKYAVAAALPDCAADGIAGLAEVYYKRKDLRSAILEYERALRKKPGSAMFQTALKQIRQEYQIEQEQAAAASAQAGG